MKIWYEADDGTFFEDEDDCYMHEQTLKHQHLNTIIFFDKEGNKYTTESNFFNDDIYQRAERVIIHSIEELADFIWLVEETGWTEFTQIDSVGEWVRHEKHLDGYWEKIGEN